MNFLKLIIKYTLISEKLQKSIDTANHEKENLLERKMYVITKTLLFDSAGLYTDQMLYNHAKNYVKIMIENNFVLFGDLIKIENIFSKTN